LLFILIFPLFFYKFDSNYGNLKSEKERHLKLFEKITSNRDKSSKEKLNIEKAVNKHIKDEGNPDDA
jgi:hypothetical protein